VRAWFPFYAADWLADEDVDLMPLEAQGAYVRLMCHQWREGSIPADAASLARLLKVHHKTFSAIWAKLEPKFPLTETGQRRLNTRLKNVQDQQALKSRRQANNADKRWKTKETDHAMALPSHSSGIAIQNQSQNQIPLNPPKGDVKELGEAAPLRLLPPAQLEPPAFDFEIVYALYPRKGDAKTRPLEKLRSSVKTPEDYARLLLSVKNFAAKMKAEGREPGMVPHFKTWANNWEDFVSLVITPQRAAGVSASPSSTLKTIKYDD
jgi:uncharacterized protein YdaU (DUF1376 family)